MKGRKEKKFSLKTRSSTFPDWEAEEGDRKEGFSHRSLFSLQSLVEVGFSRATEGGAESAAENEGDSENKKRKKKVHETLTRQKKG
jgi:hypothetical protein